MFLHVNRLSRISADRDSFQLSNLTASLIWRLFKKDIPGRPHRQSTNTSIGFHLMFEHQIKILYDISLYNEVTKTDVYSLFVSRVTVFYQSALSQTHNQNQPTHAFKLIKFRFKVILTNYYELLLNFKK